MLLTLAYGTLTRPAGSLVRVGPNELITDDPEVMRRMMAVRSEYTRGHCKQYAGGCKSQ